MGLISERVYGSIWDGMKSFVEEVMATPGGENFNACIQCGICTGSCPVAADMEYGPRKTIAMIRAGMRDEVLSSNSMWHCLSCYTCTVRCPQDVKPTELAHALESLAVQNGYRVKGTLTPDFYRSFVNSINSYGRVHEFGMMVRLYLANVPYLLAHPIATLKMLPLGLKLLLHKRMPLSPSRARGKEDLSKIIQKFREIKGNA
jgi:heterodisulfide reductase subunit C